MLLLIQITSMQYWSCTQLWPVADMPASYMNHSKLRVNAILPYSVLAQWLCSVFLPRLQHGPASPCLFHRELPPACNFLVINLKQDVVLFNWNYYSATVACVEMAWNSPSLHGRSSILLSALEASAYAPSSASDEQLPPSTDAKTSSSWSHSQAAAPSV